MPCDVFCSFYEGERGARRAGNRTRFEAKLLFAFAVGRQRKIFASPFALRSRMRLSCVYYRRWSCTSARTSFEVSLWEQEAKRRKKGEPRREGFVLGGSRSETQISSLLCVSASSASSPSASLFALFPFSQRRAASIFTRRNEKIKKASSSYSHRSTR